MIKKCIKGMKKRFLKRIAIIQMESNKVSWIKQLHIYRVSNNKMVWPRKNFGSILRVFLILQLVLRKSPPYSTFFVPPSGVSSILFIPPPFSRAENRFESAASEWLNPPPLLIPLLNPHPSDHPPYWASLLTPPYWPPPNDPPHWPPPTDYPPTDPLSEGRRFFPKFFMLRRVVFLLFFLCPEMLKMFVKGGGYKGGSFYTLTVIWFFL